MRAVFLIAITLFSCVSILPGVTQAIQASKRESPFYCNRTALTSEQRQRQKELGKILHASLLGVQELPDGYEFEFAPNPANYQALAEFTPMEHACCPFFDVSIRVEREHGKLWWRLSGREGVKIFIRGEFSSWFGEGTT